MTVSILFCEGGKKSPDVRLLTAILQGVSCVVRPSNGKYGMGDRILAHREVSDGRTIIAGILDRDFDADDSLPTEQPRVWKQGDEWFGWRWERKEVENYLIDPVVAEKAHLSKIPSITAYRNVLDRSAEALAFYTAARTALTEHRKRFSPLPNHWGRKRGDHVFPASKTLDEVACQSGIREVLTNHQSDTSILDGGVLATFNDCIKRCDRAGIRGQNYLTFYSGKDLLWGMESELVAWGFDSPNSFRESILEKLENSVENVWEWLPEWEALREEIIKYA